jgi:uncharacterized membrane protein
MPRTHAQALRSKLSFEPELWPVLLYAVPTAVLLGYTWYNTKPEYHGFDWMVVSILTLPACAIIDRYFPKVVPAQFEVLIGLVVNATIIYLLARLLSYVAVGRRR